MTPQISATISLIFIFNLLAIISQTHGWTLEKNINCIVARTNIFNRMENAANVRKEALGLCQGQDHCLGKARKLLAKSHIVSTKDKIRKDEASTTEDIGKKPDVLDIAGMDYSPAKRKPPIHN